MSGVPAKEKKKIIGRVTCEENDIGCLSNGKKNNVGYPGAINTNNVGHPRAKKNNDGYPRAKKKQCRVSKS